MDDVLKRLGHEPLVTGEEFFGDYLKGKRVLVTGGGGSIGSHICKKVLEQGVKALVIFDEYENGAFEVRQDIISENEKADVNVVIGSICDKEILKDAFDAYRPDIVFHAAAHKHVTLMEENVKEAYKNNVEGTRNVLCTAKQCGVQRLIFISTDKAVNPVSVMGKTKKECEDMIREFDCGEMRVPIVRFGNVAGSNGSVIPIFKKQIKKGGPVTLTSPDAKRFFMSMDEAVSFILAVGNIGDAGQIFVPEMEEFCIEDIAKELIKESGKDIDVKYIGLRAGEKLREELFGNDEELVQTQIPGVYECKHINKCI